MQHPQIAVIADAHFHDLHADYGFPGLVQNGRRMAVRPLAEAVRAVRVVNESYFALPYALDAIAARGIRTVVLLGDYSDDGQIATVTGLKRLLDGYAERWGMRFFATVGNHDIFATDGRHRTKRFLDAKGEPQTVTSDPHRPTDDAHRAVESPALYCRGYPDGLDPMAAFGFYPQTTDLHWETPFGASGNPADRLYEIRSPDGKTARVLMDASYLVEPFPGVWLMMIDANVFVPADGAEPGDPGAFADSTDAGWNAMIAHKSFILDWMADVSGRARAGGKCLLAFSHYPGLDPLDGTNEETKTWLGPSGLQNRIPDEIVAKSFVDAGIAFHFSGHLHVNDTARFDLGERFLINVSLPSLVAFPAAYKIVTIGKEHLAIETAVIDRMPVDEGLRQAYQMEIAASGLDAAGMEAAVDYGAFLDRHLAHLVGRRHLKREWPREIAALMRRLDLADLAAAALLPGAETAADLIARLDDMRDNSSFAETMAVAGLPPAAFPGLSAMDFLIDWYRLRTGGDLALHTMEASRLSLYRAIAKLYATARQPWRGCVQEVLAVVFRMFEKHADGLPSANFTIDRQTGTILRVEAASGGTAG